MFKKTAILLFLPVFLLTTGGVAFNVHTCKMRSTSDVTFSARQSCCGDDEMPGACCRNELKVIKVYDEYSPSYILSAEKGNSFAAELTHTVSHRTAGKYPFRSLNYHSPPRGNVPLSILYCAILA